MLFDVGSRKKYFAVAIALLRADLGVQNDLLGVRHFGKDLNHTEIQGSVRVFYGNDRVGIYQNPCRRSPVKFTVIFSPRGALFGVLQR